MSRATSQRSMNQPKPTLTGQVIHANGHVYTVHQKIGSGSFGEIYLGIDENSDQVAIKAEKAATKYPQLHEEYTMYTSVKPTHGVPEILWYGELGKFNCMIMELLGNSLESLFNKCDRKFSLKTVTMLAIQLLHRIEHHHDNHHLHRDIKPDNFVMGRKHRAHVLYLIDLGLSKRYRDPESLTHIAYSENKKLIGTPRYASINSHLGIEQCRRDDLESIGYMLMYFNMSQLPWQGLKAKSKSEKYAKILQKKAQVSVDELCRGFPPAFSQYLNYCRNLRFTQKPDYKYLRTLFYNLFKENNFKDDCIYDWMERDEKAAAAQAATSGRVSRSGPSACMPAPSNAYAQPVSTTTSVLPTPQASMAPPTPSPQAAVVAPLRTHAEKEEDKYNELYKLYADMEADRDRWKRKAEEYERYSLKIKREHHAVMDHMKKYPPTVPYTRKRKSSSQAAVERSKSSSSRALELGRPRTKRRQDSREAFSTQPVTGE